MTKVECVGEERVRFQAREVLADVEGGELTVRYLLRKNVSFFFYLSFALRPILHV